MANQLYRKSYEEDEQEIQDEENGGKQQEGNESTVEEPKFDNESDPFAKRYGDLRRGSSKALNDLRNEVATLKAKLSETTAVKPPKSPAEVKAWMEKYPDVGGIVRSIVLEEINGYDTNKAPEFNRVKELEEQIARRDVERQKEIALEEITKKHPDFYSLIDASTEKGQKFHAWVENQDDWVKYALYENETKSKPAIDAVTLYKTENKGYDKEDRKKAGAPVNRNSSSGPKESGNYRFSESMVEALSPAEYERLEPEITQAIRNGEFDYDQSGV
jgi:hypothetical protein